MQILQPATCICIWQRRCCVDSLRWYADLALCDSLQVWETSSRPALWVKCQLWSPLLPSVGGWNSSTVSPPSELIRTYGSCKSPNSRCVNDFFFSRSPLVNFLFEIKQTPVQLGLISPVADTHRSLACPTGNYCSTIIVDNQRWGLITCCHLMLFLFASLVLCHFSSLSFWVRFDVKAGSPLRCYRLSCRHTVNLTVMRSFICSLFFLVILTTRLGVTFLGCSHTIVNVSIECSVPFGGTSAHRLCTNKHTLALTQKHTACLHLLTDIPFFVHVVHPWRYVLNSVDLRSVPFGLDKNIPLVPSMGFRDHY